MLYDVKVAESLGSRGKLKAVENNSVLMTTCPSVNCAWTGFEAVLSDFFGKRKMVIWKLAACCWKPVILICKIEAGLYCSNYCTAVGLPLFLYMCRADCLSMCVCERACGFISHGLKYRGMVCFFMFQRIASVCKMFPTGQL